MCHHGEAEDWEAISRRLRERHEDELGETEGESESLDEENRSDRPEAPTPPADD